MDEVNARIDYFRSEIEGKLSKLREEFKEREKIVDAQVAALQGKLDGALRELRRI